MKARQICRMLSDTLFCELSNKHGVDYKVKKLPLRTFVKTILRALFLNLDLTLKSLATLFNDESFQTNTLKQEITTIHPTAFHYRVEKIPEACLADLFKELKKMFSKYIKKPHKKETKKNKGGKEWDLWIFDSTIVSLSNKLLKVCGYQTTGSKTRRQVKYTLGCKNGVPLVANFYSEKSYNSENRALGETILATKIKDSKAAIVLFDRGLQDRAVFDELDRNGRFFVTRLKKGYKMKILKEVLNPSSSEKVKIIKEREGYLYSKERKQTAFTYRTIHIKPESAEKQKLNIDVKKQTRVWRQSKSKKNASKTKQELAQELLEEDIIFVTNIPATKMSAEEIAAIYRERWSIEAFFKFMKQRLKFSHLLNRTENGIKSIMYITMICALMLMVFKKTNNLKGYKYVHQKFMLEILTIDTQNEEITYLEPLQFW